MITIAYECLIGRNKYKGGVFLSLIKCDYCGHMISQYARQCPKCKTKRIEVVSMNNSNVNNESAEKVTNRSCKYGFTIGIISVFIYFLSPIIPLLAIAFSVIGLTQYNFHVNKNKWLGITGLILGILYLFNYLFQLTIQQ